MVDGSIEIKTTTRLEMIPKANDRWINSHCVPIFEVWLANMDMRLTIDVGKIVDYMTKYMTKSEKIANKNIEKLFKNKYSGGAEQGQ